MGTAKLHHYVPQFYLRRFTNDDGRFWVWDKILDRVFLTSPNNVAAGSNFYRLYEFAELGQDPLAMEKGFSDIEGEVSRITDQWLRRLTTAKPLDCLKISDVDRGNVSLYIALQFCRTADARDIILGFDALPSLPQLSQDQNEFGRWATYLWGDWLVDELMKDEGRARAKAKPRLRLSGRAATEIHTRWLSNVEMIKLIAKRIEESTWIFGRNHTRHPFITSDNPVAFHVHIGDNHRWVKAGFLVSGAYPVFPLSPEVVMYCYDGRDPKWSVLTKWNNAISPVEFNVPLVRHDNGGQVFNAGRFVISPKNDFGDVREFARWAGIDAVKSGRPHQCETATAAI